MTAETMKPFLSLPNATAADLKAHCAQKSIAKRCLVALECILVVAFCCTLVGVQIWHLNKTTALQREVDDLKLQLYLRSSEFNDYELENELFNPVFEYETGYETDLDQEVTADGRSGQSTSEQLDTSSGMPGEDDDDEDTDELEDLVAIERLSNERTGEEDLSFDDTVDMGVVAGVAGGKRRARSISGVTRQGVPIVDEPYVPRRNRTRHPHRIYEQLRQRPEELVTPPTSGEKFRWDVEGRKAHPAQPQEQSYGSISIRPYQHESHVLREHHSTTPMPTYGSPSVSRHHLRNELNARNPTKPPAQILNRMSRVQSTSGKMREELQQAPVRFPKVVGNPGTQKEIVMAPESRVRLRHRKAGAVQHSGEPVAKGVHLVKSSSGSYHRNTRHRGWVAKDEYNRQAIASRSFGFDGDELTVKEPGLYYIYAQVTYDNEFDVNGYKVLVDGQKHLSCTVHAKGENTNACFTAGLAEITNTGTRIAIEDVDHDRNHVMYPEKTFFGVFKVGRLPPPSGLNHRMARKVG
ncbi:protein eiger [Anopheles nili]|uniref:protein eiger n=1 Tax=Anopheles nili TaxID=185578 RepID=UPI00237B4AE6|nr:protein eiger [Anopheles nili]